MRSKVLGYCSRYEAKILLRSKTQPCSSCVPAYSVGPDCVSRSQPVQFGVDSTLQQLALLWFPSILTVAIAVASVHGSKLKSVIVCLRGTLKEAWHRHDADTNNTNHYVWAGKSQS